MERNPDGKDAERGVTVRWMNKAPGRWMILTD